MQVLSINLQNFEHETATESLGNSFQELLSRLDILMAKQNRVSKVEVSKGVEAALKVADGSRSPNRLDCSF